MTSLYIESADEITTVIERLRGAEGTEVALVAPKGATLLQSVVNLKLTRRAADDAGKRIIIVSTDNIGRNLCAQLGIAAANTEEEAAKILSGGASAVPVDDAKVISGVRIHRYYEDEDADETAAPGTAPEPIIIPQAMLKDEPKTAPTAPIAVPASVPEPPVAAEVVQSVPFPAPVAVVTPEPVPLTRSKVTRNDTVETVTPSPTRTEKQKKEKLPPQPTTIMQKRVIKLSLWLGGAGILAIVTIAFLFLPFTRVELAVRASDWTMQLAFTASLDTKDTSTDGTQLPAEDITGKSDKTLSFTATGSQETGDKATGSVTFYNYDTTTTTTVPSGTTITASGKTFTTTASADVPGYTKASGKPPVPGTATAPITATASGPDSNLSNAPASDVKGTNGLLTFNTVSTSGGTTKTVTVVTADDIAKAKTVLTQQLTDDATKQLADQLSNRTVTSKEGTDRTVLGTLTSTVSAGEQVAGGDVKGTISIDRSIVNTPTLESAISDRLRTNELNNHSYKVTSKDITVDSVSSDGKQLSLTVKVSGKEAPVVPVEDLAKQLNGKSLSDGAQILSQAVPTATISYTQSPRWWPVKRYPTLTRYIVVEVTYD